MGYEGRTDRICGGWDVRYGSKTDVRENFKVIGLKTRMSSGPPKRDGAA